MVEHARVRLDFFAKDAQAGVGENFHELASRERARVRRIAKALDAIVDVGRTGIFGNENVNDAKAATAFQDARHFRDGALGVGNVVQAVTGNGDVERISGDRQRLRVCKSEGEVEDAIGAGAFARASENRGSEIETANPANVAREPQRERAGTTGDVYGAVGGFGADETCEAFGFAGAIGNCEISEHFRGARKAVAD